uniref:Reverse transcriptase domain-containing protein n=1 Tax=Tanacetum cinerariifolium TaxID=118510 RepID=A0A699H7G0_TANCI|nr:hypothetical protein [Tanacetum cinerariifolium]
MEYLVKISKKACILELKRRNTKITILTTNTLYPSRNIRRLRKKYRLNLKNDMPPRDKKHFKILSLDESRSPDFDLNSDQEEYSEEEVAETMAGTIEQYMSKTRADYGSRVARPKIEDKDNFDLKGQFLKELCTNTFSGSNHKDSNEHIKKVLEIVDLFHIPSITINQVMLRAFSMSLTEAASRCHTTQLNNLGREIKKVNKKFYAAQEKDPGSFTLPCYINNFCFNNALANIGATVSVMPLSIYLNLGLGELAHTKLTVELADRTVKYPKGIAKNVLVGIGKFVFHVDSIILDMPEDIKVSLILGRPFLSTAHAKIDVFKRKITLRVEEEKIIFKSIKPASCLIKKTLFGDYVKLNDLNVPLELKRDQVDDLMPTIKEGEVVEEFRARYDARMVPFEGVISNKNNVNTIGKKKQTEVSRKVEDSKSAEKIANSGVSLSNHKFFHVTSSSTSTTPIFERIDKQERQIIDEKLTLLDDDGKPLPKVISTVNEDSDSEVEDVVDECYL